MLQSRSYPGTHPQPLSNTTYQGQIETNLFQGGLNQCKPFGAVKKEYYKSFGYGQESQVDVINDAVS